MVFVTGDTHGDWMGRLNMDSFPEQKEMTKEDIVIVCGDFGIWDDSKREKYNLDWLDTRSFTTVFVDGNHSNFDILDNFPQSMWNGGKVHFIRPSVIHLMRGQVFEIHKNQFFTFGGASSHDIQDGVLEPDDPNFRLKRKRLDRANAFYRINHVSWWERELPSEEEMEEGRKSLALVGDKVDYIITHSPCTSLLKQMVGLYHANRLTDYLQDIKETVEYRHWIFGHMHVNENFPWEKSTCIYEQIVQIL